MPETKTITMKVDIETHKALKIAAAQAGVSIKELILNQIKEIKKGGLNG